MVQRREMQQRLVAKGSVPRLTKSNRESGS
jgi:hypothetical protein